MWFISVGESSIVYVQVINQGARYELNLLKSSQD
jgi:hypothetical protein